ncbi:hypothetical protein [Nonlabens xiamenensis]|uniref:hypothetical protein n=1 Tax=Nonlabens xiamenensis TaxID=2341043 RepID=UPI000F60F9A6|nr:hypothetical protein [Nonlabens xiamenensis]
MALLKKIKASTVLENLIASVILMVVFIIAGNALNQSFKSSIDNRDLSFDNEVKRTVYLIVNDQLDTPQYIEVNNHNASFYEKDGFLIVEGKKHNFFKDKICCLKR